MKKIIKITAGIDICDICGISTDEYNKKYDAITIGFGQQSYKVLGYIHICPHCVHIEKEYDKTWEMIIKNKIEIKKLLNAFRRFKKEQIEVK